MSFLRPSAAKQTTQTTGTGTLTLIANAGDTRSLQTALGSGPVKGRFMLRGQGYFEMFRGTFTAPSTLTRDEVIISSNTNTLVNIPPGTTDVYLLDYAQFMVDTFTANRTLANADASNSLIFKGSAFCTLTLPALSATLPDFWVYVKNEGTASFSVACAGGDINDENGLGFTWLDAGEDAWIFVGETNSVWRISRNRAGAPGRNKIINGDMRIDQRNAGASLTPSTTGATYTIDRWFYSTAVQTSKFSVQRNAGSQSPPPGFSYYLGCTSLAATTVNSGDVFSIGQNIEGFNAEDLNWGGGNARPITISFWVRSSLTGTFAGALQNGAGNRSYVFTYSIAAANTWTYISVTLAGDTTGTWTTDNTLGLSARLALGAGATFQTPAGAWAAGNFFGTSGAVNVASTNGATFYFTGVQIETGTLPTPFEQRDMASELLRCQRYFQSIGGALATELLGVGSCGSTAGNFSVEFKTAMRAPPTLGNSGAFLASDGTTNTSVTISAATGVGLNKANVQSSASGLTTSRPYQLYTNNDLTARLTFSAEL